MKLVTSKQMRDLDRRTMEEWGTPGEVLMDRAGQGVADIVRRLADVCGLVNPVLLLFAGRGNNGGDAFAAARYLKEGGYDVEVWLAGAANQVKGDALKHLSRMKGQGVVLRELPTLDDWNDALGYPGYADILVDGLLGTGVAGPPRGPVAGAIQYINTLGEDGLVLAIDVPSGLNADDGTAEGEAVRADITVTMALPKAGLVAADALDYVGTLEVADIGIPPAYVDESQGVEGLALVYASELRRLFPRRGRATHKGTYGRCLLVGGSRGYSGAIAMAARTAVRSGAGLVSVLTPGSSAGVVAASCLEAMVHPGGETAEGQLPASAWDEGADLLGEADAVLVGPGLGRGKETRLLVERLLASATVPIVLDADAISVFEGEPGALLASRAPRVLTPHPGELGRLLGRDIPSIQADRVGAARAAAAATGAVIVLKGAGTVIAGADRPAHINLTGNPGMASGGMGDVLAGLITGLLAQGLEPFDAACAAVHLHGRAGDLAAWRKSQAGIGATDVIDEISYVYREVSMR